MCWMPNLEQSCCHVADENCVPLPEVWVAVTPNLATQEDMKAAAHRRCRGSGRGLLPGRTSWRACFRDTTWPNAIRLWVGILRIKGQGIKKSSLYLHLQRKLLVVSSYSGVSGQRPSMLQSQLRVTELSKRYSISGTFCYRVHFGTGEIFLQGTFCCKGHFVTRDILVQGTFCYRGHFVTGDILLHGTFFYTGHFVTRDILLQGTFCFRGHCVLGLQYPCI